MKNLYSTALIVCVLSLTVQSQTYTPITNNMQINSNANIKFAAGNYAFTDPSADGVIQLNGVHDVILDGDSCFVNGGNDFGYMIKIINSSNIVIKNFDSVFDYKYAVHIMNSDNIDINGNMFSGNKVDSVGWISIWTDYQQALGGGVLMYQTRNAQIYNNNMTLQNDGVALYHCDSISVYQNDFSWNTSFGIRMYWTDSCDIRYNNCSHVNRPYTNPSDCAALLMLVSNENVVEYNDLSYSGDGVFLGQYQYSNIPNNNYFAYNECSYSPHNAIEATFADGNVYKHNKCNYSHYGFWLGYSFNTIADSNEIIGNYQTGIAVDRGFNNTFTNNTIQNNPVGVELWEGNPISGYAAQTSHDYTINDNTFYGNTLAISAKATEHLVAKGNSFDFSHSASLYFEGTSQDDTLEGNTFRMPTIYHIQNKSANDITATGNSWFPSDTAMIREKIYDHSNNSGSGTVNWLPVNTVAETPIQTNPPCDMAEPEALWVSYPETGYPGNDQSGDSLYFDNSEKMVGDASVKFVTSRGWYCALNYRPSADTLSEWSLSEEDTLYFWVRTIKQPTYGFQFAHIRIGDRKGNYFRYNFSPSLLNNANYSWEHYQFPLTGNSTFSRQTVGDMSLESVNYVSFWADSWEYGFTLWLDGVQFNICDPITGIAAEPESGLSKLNCYPNPFSDKINIRYNLTEAAWVRISILDAQGNLLEQVTDGMCTAGSYQFDANTTGWAAGVYFCRIQTDKGSEVRKLFKMQ